MTDRELNFQTMARQTQRYLAQHQAEWATAAPRLLPAYQQLETLLATLDQVGGQVSGSSTQGYTDAKDLAEDAAVATALRVVKGLRVVQLATPHPDLAAVAGFSKSGLDRLRDQKLVDSLDAVRQAGQTHATELAAEGITAAHLAALDAATAAYRPLVGAARGQAIAGSTLRTTARKLVAQLREPLDALDARLDTLEDDYPALVTGYRQARVIVDAGHGPKPDAAKA